MRLLERSMVAALLSAACAVALCDTPAKHAIPCLLRLNASSSVLMPGGTRLVSHSQFGTPLGDCTGIVVEKGTVIARTMDNSGSPVDHVFKASQKLTPELLGDSGPQSGVLASSFNALLEILGATAGERNGSSRGSEGPVNSYLGAELLWSNEDRSVDLSAIAPELRSLTFTSDDASAAPVAGVSLTNSILRIRAGTLEPDQTYRWTARVGSEEIVGVLTVLSAAETNRKQGAISPAALNLPPDSSAYFAERARRLAASHLMLDSLLAAQRWAAK